MEKLEQLGEDLANLSEDELQKLAAILLHNHGGAVGLTDSTGDPVPPDPTHPHP